jgi:hypothetical protein
MACQFKQLFNTLKTKKVAIPLASGAAIVGSYGIYKSDWFKKPRCDVLKGFSEPDLIIKITDTSSPSPSNFKMLLSVIQTLNTDSEKNDALQSNVHLISNVSGSDAVALMKTFWSDSGRDKAMKTISPKLSQFSATETRVLLDQIYSDKYKFKALKIATPHIQALTIDDLNKICRSFWGDNYRKKAVNILLARTLGQSEHLDTLQQSMKTDFEPLNSFVTLLFTLGLIGAMLEDKQTVTVGNKTYNAYDYSEGVHIITDGNTVTTITKEGNNFLVQTTNA